MGVTVSPNLRVVLSDDGFSFRADEEPGQVVVDIHLMHTLHRREVMGHHDGFGCDGIREVLHRPCVLFEHPS